MKNLLVKNLFVAASSVVFVGTAFADNLITNGDFEGGNLAGWTVNGTGCCGNSFYAIANGASVPSGNPTAFNPGGGLFAAVSDQGESGGEELRQGFTKGADGLMLSFDWFNKTRAPYNGTGLIDGSDPQQTGRVDILFAGAAPFDTGAGVAMNLLLNAGTFTPSILTIPWVSSSFDLSGLAAGSYEVRFGNGQCCSYQEFGVDNVSITLPPVPEPETYVMLLAGLGLLGFAARRRKQKEAPAA